MQQIKIREFLRNHAEMESVDSFMNQTPDNRVAKDTYTFDPMLFQFCVAIARLINFTKIGTLIKVFRKFCLKTTMMESDSFFK